LYKSVAGVTGMGYLSSVSVEMETTNLGFGNAVLLVVSGWPHNLSLHIPQDEETCNVQVV